MKMYLLSDNTDTWLGMRMAGVEGFVLHDKEEAEAKIAELMDDPACAVVLVTEKLRALCAGTIDNLMLTRIKPLFLEIPDRHGFGRPKGSVDEFIKKSIGLNL